MQPAISDSNRTTGTVIISNFSEVVSIVDGMGQEVFSFIMERTDSFTTPTFSRKKVSCVPSLIAASSSRENFSTMNGAIVSATFDADAHCATFDKPMVAGVIGGTGGGGVERPGEVIPAVAKLICLAVDPKGTLEGIGFEAVGANRTVNLISVETSRLTIKGSGYVIARLAS